MARGTLNERASIVIKRPIDEVFTMVSNPINDPRWCPTVREPQQVGEGDPAVGREYQFVHKPSPVKWAPISVKVTALEAPTVFAARSEDSQGFYDYRYELEPMADGTRITHVTESNFTGPLRFIAPFLKGHLQKVMNGQLNNLKLLLEEPAG